MASSDAREAEVPALVEPVDNFFDHVSSMLSDLQSQVATLEKGLKAAVRTLALARRESAARVGELEHEKESFKRVSDHLDEIKELPELTERVRFDVGGQLFAASAGSLLRHPECLLTRMFLDPAILPCPTDGAYFLDRDASHFPQILRFIRDPTGTWKPRGSRALQKRHEDEFAFYGLLEDLHERQRDRTARVPADGQVYTIRTSDLTYMNRLPGVDNSFESLTDASTAATGAAFCSDTCFLEAWFPLPVMVSKITVAPLMASLDGFWGPAYTQGALVSAWVPADDVDDVPANADDVDPGDQQPGRWVQFATVPSGGPGVAQVVGEGGRYHAAEIEVPVHLAHCAGWRLEKRSYFGLGYLEFSNA